MMNGPVFSSDVPSAPTLVERGAMIDFRSNQARHLQPRFAWEHTAYHHSWNLKAGFGLMACQAQTLPRQYRFRLHALIERVEDCALLRVLHGNFENRSSPNPGDGRRIVEVDRPRIVRTDENRLQ